MVLMFEMIWQSVIKAESIANKMQISRKLHTTFYDSLTKKTIFYTLVLEGWNEHFIGVKREFLSFVLFEEISKISLQSNAGYDKFSIFQWKLNIFSSKFQNLWITSLNIY
jgi:hypothetical protein